MTITLSKRKKAEDELLEKKSFLEAALSSMTDAVFISNSDGEFVEFNEAFAAFHRFKNKEDCAKRLVDYPAIIDVYMDNGELAPLDMWAVPRALRGETVKNAEYTLRRKDTDETWVGSYCFGPIRNNDGLIIGSVVIARDITEHKRVETYRRMGQDILQVLNENDNQKEAIHRVIDIIKSVTGVDAVGIRLQDENDFPYFYQEGFSQDFLLKENSLLARTKDGGICRDECGDICLECTCGLVVTGKTDPSSPLFTKGGSSWTNDSFPLLHVPVDDDIRTNPRNECIHQGFASVALIPIRAKGRVVGLLQLNDRRKGCFTLEGIETLEKIAENIGESMLRKQAEEKLRNSNELILNLLQNTDQGIYGIDPDGNCTFINRSALTMLGYESDDCIGKNMHTLIHHSYADGQSYPIKDCPVFSPRSLSGEGCRLDNEVLWRRDGTPFPAEYSSYPIIDDGKINGAVITFSDITERKRTFEQMADISQRLQLATSSAHLGVWDWNIRDNYKIWDDRMYEMYGITRDTYPDNINPWIIGIHPEDKEAAIAARQAAFDGERDFDIVFRICRLDGTVRHIKGNAIVLRDNNGKAERMIGVNADITDIVLAEEEKSKLETQLYQAQKMESVGRLAGGVAHDFNNMLTIILGHAELGLMHLEPDHPVRANFMAISKTAQRSADLTRQLLAFARRQTIAPKVLDLNETTASLLKMLQRLIGEDIHLKWHPGTELWKVNADPTQIDQILANLCVNARDAIENTGKITIETANSSFDKDYCDANFGFIPGEYVLLAMSDDGCGMDKETQAQIFEPFFTTKELGKGTGLGLATVYGIVKQNNGFIKVYSEPDQGTTFKIYLPHYRGNFEQDQKKVPVSAPRHGQESILLVEDEAGILNMTKSLLEKFGYTVLAASTPGEAITLTKEYDGVISLLLTDVVMPEMNGRELANKLRNLSLVQKCLFMSGYTANVIVHHGVLDKGVNFISKPYSAEDLAMKVREVLDGELENNRHVIEYGIQPLIK
jgi:PAS domain S-box-containing protein